MNSYSKKCESESEQQSDFRQFEALKHFEFHNLSLQISLPSFVFDILIQCFAPEILIKQTILINRNCVNFHIWLYFHLILILYNHILYFKI